MEASQPSPGIQLPTSQLAQHHLLRVTRNPPLILWLLQNICYHPTAVGPIIYQDSRCDVLLASSTYGCIFPYCEEDGRPLFSRKRPSPASWASGWTSTSRISQPDDAVGLHRAHLSSLLPAKPGPVPPFTAGAPEPTEAETGGGGLWGVVWVSVPLEGTKKVVRVVTCLLLASTEPAPEQHQDNPQEATPLSWPLQSQSRIKAQLSLNFKRQKNHLQHLSNSPQFLRGREGTSHPHLDAVLKVFCSCYICL
ncbi:PREDICTED: uncharacterized protein LOC106725493 [Myotis brandtii]|uniref:uncharacterized protein LOC106725493 n=1 Tax=Myotis brandtii TaxID=109478 RepID=UPI000703F3E3|nr:PREDICTED: uncharacterized protein LOC106725493 [Myotis brandtii]